jgi:type VI secretion system secreted protein VgrG
MTQPLPTAQFTFSCEALRDAVWHVRRFTLVEGVSEPYRLSIEIRSEDLAVEFEKLLGAPCGLQIERSVTTRVVYGMVAQLTELGVAAERVGFLLEVVPAFGLMAQVVNTRFFQEKSAPEILDAVLSGPLGVEGRRVRMDLDPGAYEKREYCVQYRESDFDFASRLMQEEGILYYFEHDPEGGAELLVLAGGSDRCKRISVLDGGATIPYIEPGHGVTSSESIGTLTLTRALRTTSVVQRDFDWLKPAESPYMHDRRVKDARNRDREVFEHDDRRLFSDDGAKRVRRKQETHAQNGKLYVGTSDVTELTPGTTFDLLGHPHAQLDHGYLLLRVRHRGEAPEETMFGGGAEADRYRNEFEVIEQETPWRPEPTLSKPKAYGLQTAIVVGPQGEEIHTDEHGRVKVHFHWDRISPFDDTASCWIRVAQRWAGPGWGALILPRIGMEVIVEFLDGDPDRPLVTGCVYNGQNRPPYPLPQEKTKSTLKSESSPGGGGFNELRFEDAKGSEEIYIHAQRDMNETILRNQSTSVGADQSLSVGDDRTKTVTGFETNTIKKDRVTTIEGTDQVTINGSHKVTINGGANKGKATDPAPLGAGVDVIGEYNITATAKLTITVGGASSLTMTPSSIELKIGGSTVNMVTGQVTVTSPTVLINGGANAASVLKLDGAADLKGGTQAKMHKGVSEVTLNDNALVKGTEATLNGTGKVTVLGGDCKVQGNPVLVKGEGGPVTVNGTTVNVTAPGIVAVTGSQVNLNS